MLLRTIGNTYLPRGHAFGKEEPRREYWRKMSIVL